MNFMKIFRNLVTVPVILLHSIFLVAGELNDVKIPDTQMVEGKALILNGMGLRVVHKFGIPVKVYVAGLYLEHKNSDSESVLKNNEVKRLTMTFVRPVDRDALKEAFGRGYEDACFSDCANKSSQYSKFAKNVVSVRKGNQITLTFYKDKIEIDTNGPNAKKQMIDDEHISRNMLSVFINKEKPPGEDFRKGLLGLK